MHKGKREVNSVIEKKTTTTNYSDIFSVQMTKRHLTTQMGMKGSTDDRFQTAPCETVQLQTEPEQGSRLQGRVFT